MAEFIKKIEARIPSGKSLSDVVDLRGHRVVGLILPEFWAAAATSLSFQVSERRDGNFVSTHNDDGTEMSISVAVSRHVNFDPTRHLTAPFIKIRSNDASGAPVVQGATRIIQLILG